MHQKQFTNLQSGLQISQHEQQCSAQDNAASMAQRVEQFCKQNKLEDLREGWEHNLIHPYSQCHIHEDNFSAVKVFDLIATLTQAAGVFLQDIW